MNKNMVASKLKMILVFCIAFILLQHIGSSLFAHIYLAAFLLSILIQQTKSFY